MEHPENNEAYKGLVVNAGIEQPSSVNPYLKNRPRRKKRELSVSDYVEGIVKGDVTVLSQAVTLVESVKPEHQAVAQEVIEKCLPYSGNSVRVGISGVPGAGKSTSIDVFGLHVLEEHGGSPFIPSPLYVPVPLPVRWVAWHARRVKRLCFVRLPVSTRYL